MSPLHPGLLRRVRPVRVLLGVSVGLGALGAALLVVQAWLLAHAVATTVEHRTLDAVAGTVPILVSVVLGRALLGWLSGVLGQRSAAAVTAQLRTEIVDARLRRPLGRDVDTDALVLTVTGLGALDGYVARFLPQLPLAVLVPATVGVAVWWADPLSAVIVAVTVPLVPLFLVLVGQLTSVRTRRRWRAQARLAHHFADLVAGLPTLQVFGRARAQAAGLGRSEDAHRRATAATLKLALLSSLVLELVAMLSVALVAVGVGLRVVDGQLALSVGLFVLMLAPEAYLPLRVVGSQFHEAADGVAAADQALALLDATAEYPVPDGRVPELRTSVIELRGVCVRYPDRDVDAVGPVDLTWRPGEVLAVTGPSGSGKSTVLRALLGLVPLRAGAVRVGASDLADLDPGAWRGRFAVVPQRPRLMSGTVAENVALGDPGADRERVERALRDAGAADLDPDRYLPAADGSLSAGELRRLAVARALVRLDRPGVQALLLDEPTAGLDAQSEARVVDAVRRAGVAALVVTHRPAVLARADRVVHLGVASAVAA